MNGIGKGLKREGGKGKKKFMELWRAGRRTLKRNGFVKEGDRLIWGQR